MDSPLAFCFVFACASSNFASQETNWGLECVRQAWVQLRRMTGVSGQSSESSLFGLERVAHNKKKKKKRRLLLFLRVVGLTQAIGPLAPPSHLLLFKSAKKQNLRQGRGGDICRGINREREAASRGEHGLSSFLSLPLPCQGRERWGNAHGV